MAGWLPRDARLKIRPPSPPQARAASAARQARRRCLADLLGLMAVPTLLPAALSACSPSPGSEPAKAADAPLSLRTDPPQAVLGVDGLVNQSGQPVQDEQLTGKTVLLNFALTGCASVCPVATQRIVEFQQGLPAAYRERIQLLTVTVDPRQDGPEQLAAYARRFEADLRNWHWLTGPERVVDALLARYGALDPRRVPLDPQAHTTHLLLFDRRGRLTQRYDLNVLQAPRLLREAQALDDLYASHA